jgi:hypothetical protein
MSTEQTPSPITNIFDNNEAQFKETPKLNDQQINDKYRKGEMRIVTEQGRIDIFTIHQMLNPPKSENGQSHKKYKLNPEYQRRKRWNNGKKSRLIESLIMNVPLPPIFLYEVRYAEYEVMDGLQRLTAINEFYENKFSLTDLEHWKELEGRTYNELPTDIRAGIDRRYLSSVVLLEESAKTEEEASFMKKTVFERLNSGGEKLTEQEMRNALHDGKFNKLCIELAKNEKFRTMWHLPQENQLEESLLKTQEELSSDDLTLADIELYRKMGDVELVLRFFAYRHIESLKDYKDKDSFLTETLKRGNKSYSENDIKNLSSLFEKTIDVVYTILGKRAFYIPIVENFKDNTRDKPTKTMFDGIMQAFAKYIEYADIFLSKKEILVASLYTEQEAMQSKNRIKNTYIFDGRYNSWSNVKERIDYFDNILKKFIPNT